MRTLALAVCLRVAILVTGRRAAILVRQRRVTAKGSRTDLGVRQSRSRGAVLVNIPGALAKGPLAVQGATLLGDELAALVLRHAAGTQGAVRLRAVRLVSENVYNAIGLA